MDRRRFLQTTSLMSAAFISASTAEGNPQDRTNPNICPVAPNGTVTLSNDLLLWELNCRKGILASSRFENRITGSRFTLSFVQELILTFSASRHRIDIPWWRFICGADQTTVPPTQEQGLKSGYNLPDYSDREWGATDNLLLRRLSGRDQPPNKIKYDGYGWFRYGFELPEDAQGEEIVLVLGGYDHQDWAEYWVYVNGVEIGHRLSSGRWRTPGEYVLAPGSAHYSALRFGSGEKNLIAVRTRGYDKHFGGLSDEVLKHYVFEPVLADQFISVGKPYLRVADFEVRGVEQKTNRAATFDLQSLHHPIHVAVHYELDGPTRRKWLEVRNQSSHELLLLDVQIDDFALKTLASEGGHGEPVFFDEGFCALEHPTGVNQGDDGRVKMIHFPAVELEPGVSFRSHVSLVSVSKAGQALQHFVSYIQERSPRKKRAVSIYDPFGINNQWGGCPTLTDVEMLDGLNVLEKWQQTGMRFDYYVPDTGWVDHSSDLTRFAPQCFPNGPSKVVDRINSLGMKFGLWFGTSWGAESCSAYPPVWTCQTPAPGGPEEPGPPPRIYRNGYLTNGGVEATLCLASEPYFSILRNAILHHIRENSLKFFKLDGGSYYCNSTRHQHLPGKYSVEAMYNRLLEIARDARQLDPDIYVMWYWGVRSPFFALHGDSIFESGLFMEGSGTSWFPALYYRDSVTLNLDQGTWFAKLIPPINKDSLGVWLADTRWGNFMGNERWREALVMDLGRGNLLFPQLWGDIYLLNESDVDFLSKMRALAQKNETVFLGPRAVFGDPWKNEVYGYAYFRGSHGFIFANNMHFGPRKVELDLGPALHLEAPKNAPLKIISHFPNQTQLRKEDGSTFRAGERAEIWLRPFEVLMLEVEPEGINPESFPIRRTSTQQFERLGIPLPLSQVEIADWMKIRFADAERFKTEGKRRQTFAYEAALPSLEEARHILAIPVRLRRESAEWQYSPSVAEIVQVVARVAGQDLVLIPVPDARQYGDTQKAGCSWVLYKIRLNPSWSHKELKFAVHAYLPEDVELQTEAWVIQQWWQEGTRPLGDNYYAEEPS